MRAMTSSDIHSVLEYCFVEHQTVKNCTYGTVARTIPGLGVVAICHLHWHCQNHHNILRKP